MPLARRIPELSIIIPVLNEASEIAQLLQRLQHFRAQGSEIIVVDGGSADATLQLAAPLADRVCAAPTGRGSQMNAGAAVARGGILLFLHADTRLPEAALASIRQAMERGAAWGRFDVHIEGKAAGLALVAAMMNWRSRLTGIATGDQAVFVSRNAFVQLGGFPDIPLMEDIVFSKKMRAMGRPACLDEKVTTSGRRWEKHGVWRTIVLMWTLRLRFFLGSSPRQLAREYGYVPREH